MFPRPDPGRRIQSGCQTVARGFGQGSSVFQAWKAPSDSMVVASGCMGLQRKVVKGSIASAVRVYFGGGLSSRAGASTPVLHAVSSLRERSFQHRGASCGAHGGLSACAAPVRDFRLLGYPTYVESRDCCRVLTN